MPLDPLATVADLTARGIELGAGEDAIAATYLQVASEAVRDASGAAISQGTSTIVIPGRFSSRLRLPGAPIVSVTAVAIDDDPTSDWVLVGDELYRGSGLAWAPSKTRPVAVTVTYTHGLAEVPADIVDLVCRMVAAALVATRSATDGTGLAVDRKISERLGDYAVTWDADARMTDMQITAGVAEALASRFGSGAATVGTSG